MKKEMERRGEGGKVPETSKMEVVTLAEVKTS